MSDDPKLCILPWNQLFVSNSGAIYPCCHGPASLMSAKDESGEDLYVGNPGTITRTYSADYFQKIRKDLAAGVENKTCQYCWNRERAGIISLRQSVNKDFEELYQKLEKNHPAVPNPVDIRILDLRLGNHCNLACRMCAPHSSEKLLDEFKEMTREPQYISNLRFDWFKSKWFWEEIFDVSPNLEQIHFAGGEPFLIKEAWNFLKRLVKERDTSKISLSFNTNLTLIPKEAYELWPKFKEVKLLISVDGIGPLFEYVRYPGKWATLEKNLQEVENNFKQLNLTEALIGCTVQAYNFHTIPNMCDYFSQFKFIGQHMDFNILEKPHHFSIANLPSEHKLKVRSELKLLLAGLINDGEKHLHYLNSIKYLIDLTKSESDPKEWRQFWRWTEFFDSKRNQSWQNFLPHFEQYKI
ncbi:MAG: radical SAM protein [Halobacteriovoraceae bacterium]|nr:radical SAM protein [Halobacteriovoraceae bacterium]MBT5094613.1 radical SAM protein [Halobacteriovoraceae bacterium]